MKTLVMLEAFGGQLSSEPFVMDIHLSANNIFVPFVGESFVPLRFTEDRPVNSFVRRARFLYRETVRLPNWELPIRKFVLVEIS